MFEAQVLRDPPEKSGGGLRAPLERWLCFYERRVFTGGCFFVITAVESAGQDGPVREALASAVERQLAALESAIVDAARSGELELRGDAGQMAFELHWLLVNSDALFHVREDPAVFERARASIRALLAQHGGARET